MRIVNTLSAQRLPLLATLNFDGRLQASPAHALDDNIFDSFRKHQHADKGFGAALGPGAADILEAALDNAGYTVISGDSSWRMDLDTQKLMHEVLKGISTASIEIGTVPESDVKEWLADRLSHTNSLAVGHRDVFAAPTAN